MLFKKKQSEEKAEVVSVAELSSDTNASEVETDIESVMRKYDRESNTRVWEGVPKTVVSCLMVLFSL